MAAPIVFKRGRLLVGYRARDWSKVWYKIEGEVDAEGGAEIGLYKLNTGDADFREPMEGEVKWYPVFDPANCESKIKKEREEMHKQTLCDAWSYLNEKDPGKIGELEEKLDNPSFMRWNAWFVDAKAWKRKNGKQRATRREKRTREAHSDGLEYLSPQDQVEHINSSSSEEGYGSESDAQALPVREWSVSMGPPPPPRRSNDSRSANRGPKRGRQADNDGSATKKSKKNKARHEGLGLNNYAALNSRQTRDRSPSMEIDPAILGKTPNHAATGSSRGNTPYMSGGLGFLTPNPSRNQLSGADSPDGSMGDSLEPSLGRVSAELLARGSPQPFVVDDDEDDGDEGNANFRISLPGSLQPGERNATTIPRSLPLTLKSGNNGDSSSSSASRVPGSPNAVAGLQTNGASAIEDLDEWNGAGVSEEQAIERAVRESAEPERRNGRGNDQEIGAQESIEIDGDE